MVQTSTTGPTRLCTEQQSPPSIRTPLNLRNASLLLLSAFTGTATAQQSGKCISLKGSTACRAFQSGSVLTSPSLINFYPFLDFVSDRQSFDDQLTSYVKTSFVKDKYQSTFGCHDINFTNSSDMYARYSTTVICNAIVQMSMAGCQVAQQDARPVCAETCAEFAQSEAYITADKDLCNNPNGDLNKLIRADFTNCALPEQSLSGGCVSGVDNEPDNCGFGNSTIGLCSYCGAGGINSTDTCCYNSNAEKRCQGVKLPVITATMTFTTPTASPTNPVPVAKSGSGGGLSGGAIAGIVIGALAGVVILAALLFFCIGMMRRRRGSQHGSIFNQPSPARKGPPMAHSNLSAPTGYEVLPGGRIARMSALEGHSGDSPSQHHSSPSAREAELAAVGKHSDNLSSSEFGGTPSPEIPYSSLHAPPAASRRQASLSSNSILHSEGPHSPRSGGSLAGFSSPGVGSNQSEQLPFFKDYYSQDDIHPGDKVAVLWAYQPRAVDEFALERGDMLKVVGIWDDGWATGHLVDQRADEWESRRRVQRDSGVSNTSGARDTSPDGHGDLKAFPLVCVCLPDHWRKTIEGGDGSTDTAASALGHSALS
ncbi:hypothetical protein PT974_00806 [Cladobotryum mycophilum]|uniref:SH3 domain-containing protein n=1 Tax=Cladobotryum mycophilum TaxID=491253 RepID=A0ABR0T1X6_9HYPO